MQTWRVVRSIGAEPTSAALLMGGLTALSLWPGLEDIQVGAGPVGVRLTLPLGPALPVTVRAEWPQRTPFAITCRFSARGPEVPDLDALLTLRPLRRRAADQLVTSSRRLRAARAAEIGPGPRRPWSVPTGPQLLSPRARPGTSAELLLEVGDGGHELTRRVIPLRAARFLDALAEAAEARAAA